MKHRAEVLVEVQEADSIEVWDYQLFPPGDEAEEFIDELNMGRIFPLDENDIIIEPVHGIHEFVLEIDPETDLVEVISAHIKEEYDE